MTLYIAGDSHANLFENDPNFVLRTLGGCTAYNLRRDNNRIHSREALIAVINEMNRETDWLLISAGEIDVRVHIYKHWKRNNGTISSGQLLANTVLAYAETLEWLDSKGIRFIIIGIAPPGREKIDQEGFTHEQRAQYYKEFNERMISYARQRKYPYIDIYSKCVGNDGFMRLECAMNNQDWQMHIGYQMKDTFIDLMRKEMLEWHKIHAE